MSILVLQYDFFVTRWRAESLRSFGWRSKPGWRLWLSILNLFVHALSFSHMSHFFHLFPKQVWCLWPRSSLTLKKVGGRLPAGAVEKMNYGPPGKAVLCQVLLVMVIAMMMMMMFGAQSHAIPSYDEIVWWDVTHYKIEPSQGSEILHHVTPVRYSMLSCYLTFSWLQLSKLFLKFKFNT